MALFPTEIDTTKMTCGEKTDRTGNNTEESGDYSIPVYHDGKSLFLQVDDVRIVFGLLTYSNPQNNNTRYSTGIDADDKKFRYVMDVMEQIEEWVNDAPLIPLGTTYFSFIRTNANKQSHIRVKVPGTRNNRLNCMLYVNEREYCKPHVDTFKQYIEHNTRASAILKLNDVWCCAEKFGVSWCLDSIRITTNGFR